ncbi:hypothetical protein NQD34_001746 [Periophthalmus magnuspinnatus]|nr:hypothetical protein NQD34_001746 [Periophthalmus magnuspinnatus]
MSLCELLVSLLPLWSLRPSLGLKDHKRTQELLTENISARILTSHKASALLPPKTRTTWIYWSQSCLWSQGSLGLVSFPYSISTKFNSYNRYLITAALQAFHSYSYKQGGRQVVSMSKRALNRPGAPHAHTQTYWANMNTSMAYNFYRSDSNNLNMPSTPPQSCTRQELPSPQTDRIKPILDPIVQTGQK